MDKEELLREMERIKQSEGYKKYQEENKPKIAASKALNKLEPWLVGKTEDGSNVFAPIAGPTAAQVEHLKRRVWVCAGCRTTIRFRGRIAASSVVDFGGKVYHRSCYERLKSRNLLVGKEGEDGTKKLEDKKTEE